MNFEEYQQNALKTESIIDVFEANPVEFAALIDMIVVVGKLADLLKKEAFYGKKKPELRAEVLRVFQTIAVRLSHAYRGNDDFKKTYTINPRVVHGIIGKFTESTELVEALQKTIRSNKELDAINIGEEVGDDQWYTALLLDALELDMSKIQKTNIDKLAARYPKKFTQEGAENRDLDQEREILEKGIE